MSDGSGRAFGTTVDVVLDAPTCEALRLVRDAIYNHSGNWFDDSALYLLRRRLASRLTELALPDFHAQHVIVRPCHQFVHRPQAHLATRAEYCNSCFHYLCYSITTITTITTMRIYTLCRTSHNRPLIFKSVCHVTIPFR